MPFPPIFHPPSQDWLSPLIVVSKGLASVANCMPFPRESSEDLKYLAQSVVTHAAFEEMASHSAAQDTRFGELCLEFSTYVDVMAISENLIDKQHQAHVAAVERHRVLVEGRVFIEAQEIPGSPRMRDEITDFTRRVNDLRANTTLVAAIGTRMDLVAVANGVAAVESKISAIQQDSNSLTQTKATRLSSELARFEENLADLNQLETFEDSFMFYASLRFALVNVPAGKFLLSHIEQASSYPQPSEDLPFMDWFASVPAGVYEGFVQFTHDPESRILLGYFWVNMNGLTIHQLLTSRGRVYRIKTAPGCLMDRLPVTQLPELEITHPDSWSVAYHYHTIALAIGSQGRESWPGFPGSLPSPFVARLSLHPPFGPTIGTSVDKVSIFVQCSRK
ncbi:hypothetical protein FB451DRAFT_1406509 [Mycena latifolia]|nr:hypothetical protein FB451DRAFT_1406509 [Mycena latifolia]